MNVIKLCIDCKAHKAIEDGNRCPDCLNAYIRQTRPLALVTSPWVRAAQEHRLTPKAIA